MRRWKIIYGEKDVPNVRCLNEVWILIARTTIMIRTNTETLEWSREKTKTQDSRPWKQQKDWRETLLRYPAKKTMNDPKYHIPNQSKILSFNFLSICEELRIVKQLWNS